MTLSIDALTPPHCVPLGSVPSQMMPLDTYGPMRIRWYVVFDVKCSIQRPVGVLSMSRSWRSEPEFAFIVITPIHAQLRARTRRTIAVLPTPTQASAVPLDDS